MTTKDDERDHRGNLTIDQMFGVCISYCEISPSCTRATGSRSGQRSIQRSREPLDLGIKGRERAPRYHGNSLKAMNSSFPLLPQQPVEERNSRIEQSAMNFEL